MGNRIYTDLGEDEMYFILRAKDVRAVVRRAGCCNCGRTRREGLCGGSPSAVGDVVTVPAIIASRGTEDHYCSVRPAEACRRTRDRQAVRHRAPALHAWRGLSQLFEA